MKRFSLKTLAATLLLVGTAAAAQQMTLNIEAQPMPKALAALAAQTGMQLIFPSAEVAKNLRAPAVSGRYTAQEALKILLANSGLQEEWINERTVAIRVAQVTSSALDTNPVQHAQQVDNTLQLAQAEGQTATKKSNPRIGDADSQEIVVTGTNIRGVYPSSSPVQIYTAEDIARTGATTTEQFIGKLPQNLGSRTQFASNADPTDPGTLNRDAVNTIDLRGLGVGTTLTLMNGRRLGSADFGRSVDVSLIPVGAIERVEVLTDGASAIYGSDAIGGVVNFVLREDFDGLETRLSHGGVTRGNLRQSDAMQTFGRQWNSGRGLVSYNYYTAEPLQRFDRSYAAPAGRGFLSPDETRHNALLTLSQDIGERFTVSGDFAFARREVDNEATAFFIGFPTFDSFVAYDSETDQSFGNLGLDYRFSDRLNASLQASYSQVDVDSRAVTLNFNSTPQTTSTFISGNAHSTLDVTAMLTGSLFDLPGGTVRFSVGGGQLDEEYLGKISLSGVASNRELGRRTSYAFAEVWVPLIDNSQGIPFVRRLELSLAGRYTAYDDASSPPVSQDFGDATDPKVGLYWQPVESLGLRGTYGTSFRAPALTQLDPSGPHSVAARPTTIAGIAAYRFSASPFPAGDLEPEVAETFTLGFDFRPTLRRSFRISGTYYNIDYTDRIASAPRRSDAFANPAGSPDAIYRPASVAQIRQIMGEVPLHPTIGVACPGVSLADRAALATCIFNLPNVWVEDNRIRNLALSEQDGFDLQIEDRFDTRWGNLSLGAGVTKILGYRQQGSLAVASVDQINLTGTPVDMKARMFVGVSRGAFSGTAGINYVDDYRNRIDFGGGSIDSWTTVDLSLGYTFESDAPAVFNGVDVSLSAQNLFDRDPPFVPFTTTGTPMAQIGFDQANANPLGRLVVLGLTKRW